MWRSREAARAGSAPTAPASRCALRRPCHRGIERGGDRRAAGLTLRLPRTIICAGAAPEGMDLAAARSVAGIADADAAAVPAAAGAAAVALLRRGYRRPRRTRASARHGRGAARGRARLARDLR